MNRPRFRPENPSRGFTLLEMLVAILVLALLMTAAFGAVRLAGRSYETGINRSAMTEETRTVSDFLRRQFAQLVPVSWRDDGPQYAFAGDPTSIRFVAPAPRHPAAGGLLIYTLGIRNTHGSQSLVLAYQLFDPGQPDRQIGESASQLVLAEGIDAISFQFYGSVEVGHSAPSWREVWPQEENSLPELVKISLTSTKDPTGWPEMIFRIRAEAQS